MQSMKSPADLAQENLQIQSELAKAHRELTTKDKALAEQASTLKSQEAFIEQLKEALIVARNTRFAAATESLRSLQCELFNEAETVDAESVPPVDGDDEADTIDVPSHQRRRGGRKPLPADLPRIDVVHELDESERRCTEHDVDLKEIGEKISEQLDIIPMQIQVIRHRRKQYACPCCEGHLKTAPKPKQPIEKSWASAGLLAYIATSKYADGLPLYRLSGILNRFDIDLDRTTLASWMIRMGQLAQPLINRIEEQLLSAPYIHMDETPVQVLNEAGKSAESKSYMWVRCAGPPNQRLILFDYDPSRSGAVPTRLLADYQGAIMVDGYEGYSAVCQHPGITRLGCWVHARRKFVEAVKAQSKAKKNTKAEYAIKLMGKLYAIERRLDDERSHYDDEAFIIYRQKYRLEHAGPLLTKLKSWLDANRPTVAPKTALGKALHYLNHQWPRLVRYLDDGQYPIDNNPVENAIRPFAIGRKNWLFSTSVQGAKASANLYGLIETAKANGLEPYAYLKKVFAQLPNINGYEDVDKLLPINCK